MTDLEISCVRFILHFAKGLGILTMLITVGAWIKNSPQFSDLGSMIGILIYALVSLALDETDNYL